MEKIAAVLFSGGKDSLLTVCKLISMGYIVDLITMDTGRMSNVGCVLDSVQYLKYHFGSDRIRNGKVFSSAAPLYEISEKYLYSKVMEFSEKYPVLRPSQLNCLHCHSAMYTTAITYCMHNSIQYLATGDREDQGFAVELRPVVSLFSKLLGEYDIRLLNPVYELHDDLRRILSLRQYGIDQNFIEPQCWIGCPLGESVCEEELEQICDYVKNHIFPIIRELVPRYLENGFSHMMTIEI